MAETALRVRMYRLGLGDCFLVSVPRPDGTTFRLMIDCGVVLGTAGAADRLRLGLADIIEETGGFVDVLAVTHEHYDHVSGFGLATDLFSPPGQRVAGKLAVGAVWFAWTEDPADATAQRLRTARAKGLAALTALAGRVDGIATHAPGVVDALRYLGFGANGGGGGTADAMQFAAQLAPPTYLRPGDTRALPAEGVRFHVLGPPADEALRKTDSTTEVYHLDRLDLDQGIRRWLDDPSPFESFYEVRLSSLIARRDAADGAGREPDAVADFVNARYLGPVNPAPEADPGWRRIDADWLDGAEQLALALDDATNNTSLVLALEIAASRKVLLFAADAQVGNWLSWHSVHFGDGADAATGPDLLARTVFYKVGHHGSHNATLKAKGLELMTSPELVAFIPVDHAMAVKKRWGQMPLPNLVQALGERCQGRVVRVDEDVPAVLAQAVAKGPDGGPFGALWYEWTMPLTA